MPNLSQYEPIAEAIARLFHPHVEVVLHDILENRIVAIFNSFSRRKSGDNSLIADVQSLAAIASVQGPFEKWGEDGRRIRYVSSVLRDDRGEAVGLMCVNFDTSSLASIQTSIETFLGSTADSSKLDRLFNDDWQVRIGAYVSTFLQERNQSLGSLGPGERADLAISLHAVGAFRAKNAAKHVANVLGVSRATVYKYLSQVVDGNPERGAQDHDDAVS